jgi:dienelactone hydrolase
MLPLLLLTSFLPPQLVQTPEERARSVVAELVAGQYDRVEARYDATMQQALPPGRLATGWSSAAQQLGPYKSIKSVQTQQIGTNTLVLVACVFEKYDITLRIVFNDKGQLAGFSSLPPVSNVVWTVPDYADPSLLEERPVTVRTGTFELPGVLTLPKAGGKHPAVVLVHGSGPSDMDESIGPNKTFKDLAVGLASRGVAVLRYEKRTHKYGANSSADLAAFTVKDEEMDDAAAAVAQLATMPDINASKIFVLGHSEGGYVAPRIASGNPKIAGIVLLAGNVRPLEDLIVEQVRYEASLAGPLTPAIQQAIDSVEASAKRMKDPDLKPGMTVPVLNALLPASYILDMRAYHPTEVAKTLTIPILVLQGERDYQVTMTDFNLWKEALGGRPNVTFKSYPGLNHLFVTGPAPSRPIEYQMLGHVDRVVIEDIAAWCRK